MRTAGLVVLWIPVVLWCDRVASPAAQVGLGVATWALLIGLLWRRPVPVRVQTAVVVVFATVVEYVFSGWLGVYEYRLDHVPAYVPPGHGLVYLAAVAVAGSPLAVAYRRPLVAATVVVASGWAAWGVFVSPRPDVLGAFWLLCLLGFLAVGRAPLLYVGAFVVVSWLELLGTAWGVWQWQPVDTLVGWVSIGNPPSVAAGGYGWFDLAAVAVTPLLLRLVGRVRRWGLRRATPQLPESRTRTAAACSSPLLVSVPARPSASGSPPYDVPS
ncbi:MAG: hypothetical protein EPO13_09785 [Actinomycetota bacterium]|nr:MAG: hypothetical protein EPO13_09785 [Actinomycetota bacterium]